MCNIRKAEPAFSTCDVLCTRLWCPIYCQNWQCAVKGWAIGRSKATWLLRLSSQSSQSYSSQVTPKVHWAVRSNTISCPSGVLEQNHSREQTSLSFLWQTTIVVPESKGRNRHAAKPPSTLTHLSISPRNGGGGQMGKERVPVLLSLFPGLLTVCKGGQQFLTGDTVQG